jgi:hypothetical protein
MKELNFFLASLVLAAILSGCATTMTTQQYDTWARDAALLDMCSEKGLLNQNIASQKVVLLKNVYNNSIVDDEVLNSYMKQYYSYKDSVNAGTCNEYAVKVGAELIQHQQFKQNLTDINNTLSSMAETAQKNKPTYTNCTNLGFGTTSCTTY